MKWMLLTILVAVCVGLSQAFKCYTCGDPYLKTTPPGCGENFNASSSAVTEEPCSQGTCVKTYLEAGDVYLRACDVFDVCTISKIGKEGCLSDSTGKACCCSTNLCNAGSPVTAAIVSSLAAVILAMVI